MSEEKLYAVKNKKGLYLSFSADTLHRWREGQVDATTSQRIAHDLCTEHGGHVVTLIEEPKKVVLTKEQAEIVEEAYAFRLPATYISENNVNSSCLEKLLMNAYVNGYTVAKEKKYNVKVPYAVESYFKKIDDKYCIAGNRSTVDLDEDSAQFTEAEIEHYGLQDCERVEINTEDSDDN